MKFDEKDYYERKGITTPTEVKETYEYATANNIPFYRCVSQNGLYFGWIESEKKHTKARLGQEWFENPHYVAPNKIEHDEPIDNLVTLESAQDIISEEKQVINNMPQPEETEREVDYKALYEEQKTLLVETQNRALEYATKYGEVKAELDAIKTAFAVIAKELGESENIGE